MLGSKPTIKHTLDDLYAILEVKAKFAVNTLNPTLKIPTSFQHKTQSSKLINAIDEGDEFHSQCRERAFTNIYSLINYDKFSQAIHQLLSADPITKHWTILMLLNISRVAKFLSEDQANEEFQEGSVYAILDIDAWFNSDIVDVLLQNLSQETGKSCENEILK